MITDTQLAEWEALADRAIRQVQGYEERADEMVVAVALDRCVAALRASRAREEALQAIITRQAGALTAADNAMTDVLNRRAVGADRDASDLGALDVAWGRVRVAGKLLRESKQFADALALAEAREAVIEAARAVASITSGQADADGGSAALESLDAALARLDALRGGTQ